MSTAADAFREIDALAYEANRQLDIPQYDYRVMRGLLGAIGRLTDNGLREALANEPKLEAYDAIVAWLTRWGNDLRTEIAKYTEVDIAKAKAALANTPDPSTREPT